MSEKKAILVRIKPGGVFRINIIPSIIIDGNVCNQIVGHREAKLNPSADGFLDEITVEVTAYPVINEKDDYAVDVTGIPGFPRKFLKTYVTGQQGNIVDQIISFLRSYGYYNITKEKAFKMRY